MPQGVFDKPAGAGLAAAANFRFAGVAFVEGGQQPLQLGDHSGKAALRIASLCSLGIRLCQSGILSREVCSVAATVSLTAVLEKSGWSVVRAMNWPKPISRIGRA